MADEAATKLRIEIGRRVRLLRYARYGKRKRKQFIEDTGIPRSALDRIEKGQERIEIRELIILKRKCKATYDWLLEGIDDDMPRELSQKIDSLLHKSDGKK